MRSYLIINFNTPFRTQLDDVMVNLESTRGLIANLEKKQKKFDAQLAEQQSLSERNAQERDAAEARARQAETKSLSLTHELEEMQDKLEEIDRLRKQLQVIIVFRVYFGVGGGGVQGVLWPTPCS
jgi:chromosome segregation ATPase